MKGVKEEKGEEQDVSKETGREGEQGQIDSFSIFSDLIQTNDTNNDAGAT